MRAALRHGPARHFLASEIGALKQEWGGSSGAQCRIVLHILDGAERSWETHQPERDCKQTSLQGWKTRRRIDAKFLQGVSDTTEGGDALCYKERGVGQGAMLGPLSLVLFVPSDQHMDTETPHGNLYRG